jgi:hypothetical protein
MIATEAQEREQEGAHRLALVVASGGREISRASIEREVGIFWGDNSDRTLVLTLAGLPRTRSGNALASELASSDAADRIQLDEAEVGRGGHV